MQLLSIMNPGRQLK